MANLHSPKNLPPLNIEKASSRVVVENNPRVAALLSSKLLLDRGLNSLLSVLLGSTKDINELLETREDLFPLARVLDPSGKFYRRILSNSSFKKQQSKGGALNIGSLLTASAPLINKKLKERLQSSSNKIQEELDIFETSYKLKLNILEGVNLHFCKKCRSIVSVGQFRSSVCACGVNILVPQLSEALLIYRLDQDTIQFIENNIWLEHGIDYILRKKGFDTLCGYYVMGHSGILHEIDNIAEKTDDALRVFCECKTGDITISDIFIFAGKMQDIGCTRGYIFTTSFDVSKEVIRLARSRNIAIVEQVLEKSSKDVLKEIQEIQ